MDPVKQSSKKREFGKKKGSRSPSENSLDGSCHSIKDLLSIDSIHENKQSESEPEVEYKFDDNGDSSSCVGNSYILLPMFYDLGGFQLEFPFTQTAKGFWKSYAW